MKYTLTLSIPGLPKPANQMLRRSHWAVTAEHRKWHKIVAMHCHGRKPKKPLEKANVGLIRHSSTCPDADGLVSSFKAVLDGLVRSGVLLDDKMTNIGMPAYSWTQAPRGKGSITVVVNEY